MCRQYTADKLNVLYATMHPYIVFGPATSQCEFISSIHSACVYISMKSFSLENHFTNMKIVCDEIKDLKLAWNSLFILCVSLCSPDHHRLFNWMTLSSQHLRGSFKRYKRFHLEKKMVEKTKNRNKKRDRIHKPMKSFTQEIECIKEYSRIH